MGDTLGAGAWDVLGDSHVGGSSATISSSTHSVESDSNVSTSSSSGGLDPGEFKSLLICSIVAFGLYAFLAVAGLVQFVRLVRVRYLPRFVVQKAYALLLLIAAICLLFPFGFFDLLQNSFCNFSLLFHHPLLPQCVPKHIHPPTSTVRSVFFILLPLTEGGRAYLAGDYAARRASPVFSILSDTGEMLLCFAFSLLGLFWAEIACNAAQRRAAFARRVRPAFFTLLAAYAALQFTCWVLLFFLPRADSALVARGKCALDLALYAACTLFTLGFAAAVFRRVHRNPVRSPARTRKLSELVSVTAACLLFHVFHAATTVLYLLRIDVRGIGSAGLTVVCFVCEVLPGLALLYVLRHIPPSHASASAAAAQPINAAPVYSYASMLRSGMLPAVLVQDIENKRR